VPRADYPGLICPRTLLKCDWYRENALVLTELDLHSLRIRFAFDKII